MNKLTIVEDIYVTEYPDYSSFKKDNAWKKFFTDPNTRQERFEKMGVKINGNVAIIPIDILDIGLNFNYEKNPYTFKMILLKHLKEIYNNELKNKPSIKINLTMSLQQAIETSEIHHIQQFDILLGIYLTYLGYTIKHEARKEADKIKVISLKTVERMNNAARL